MMRTRFETEAKGNLEMAYNNNQYTAAQRTNQIPKCIQSKPSMTIQNVTHRRCRLQVFGPYWLKILPH